MILVRCSGPSSSRTLPSSHLLRPRHFFTDTVAGALPPRAAEFRDAASLLSRHRSPSSHHPPNLTSSPAGADQEWTFLDALRNSSRSPSMTTLAKAAVHHTRAIKTGLSGLAFVGNPLLNLYAKTGCTDDARKLFDEISHKDAITWTTLVTGYSRKELYSAGLSAFAEMVAGGGVAPNCFTLASTFRCCSALRVLSTGREIHGWILRNGVGSDIVLENSMIDFYAKCGKTGCAQRVFERMSQRNVESWNIMITAHLVAGDAEGSVELFRRLPIRDVVSWNTIISGQLQCGYDHAALELLYEMVAVGPEFNHFTLSTSLVLAGNLASLQLGRQIHCRILRVGLGLDVFLRNSLICMYCKCGKTESASWIFNNMLWFADSVPGSSIFRDRSMSKTISLSSMVAGYVQNGWVEEALYLFQRMLREYVEVDQFTLTSIVAACSNSGILEQGRQAHACIEKLGHGFDVVLSSALIDMYAKCGSIEDAQAVFDGSNFRNVILWTSIIGSFAMYGKGREAIQLFKIMLKENIVPNDVSFVNVLSACSHAGLVEEGYKYFRSMQEDHCLDPKSEHFTCMVDLLGRAGLLNEAKDFIYKNNLTNSTSVWRSLLSACRIHNNIEMAKEVSGTLVQLEPSDANSYILLSNIYSGKRWWKEASKVRAMMIENGATNKPGQSWIQLKDQVHTFVAGDRSHPQINEIIAYLEMLVGKLEEMGYRKEASLTLHDVEEEERETLLSFHSEKLAIACGIISTPNGVPIRVMKNLRVCRDCHTAIKYISEVTGREIVLRDAHRFHRFKHGSCSCGDFW